MSIWETIVHDSVLCVFVIFSGAIFPSLCKQILSFAFIKKVKEKLFALFKENFIMSAE